MNDDLNVTLEALLQLRAMYTAWLPLIHVTESEKQLAKIKIALIDKELETMK